MRGDRMNFKDLDVWKRSVRLSADIYKSTVGCRDYGFRDQLTRSGLSIPSNIAEGTARLSDKESIRFLSVARGSAAELETQILIGMDVGYVSRDEGKQWLADLSDIQAMLAGLVKRYRRNTEGDQRVGVSSNRRTTNRRTKIR